MKYSLVFVLSVLFTGCSTVDLKKERKVALLEEREMYCPSKNEEARLFYQAAHAATKKNELTKAKKNYHKAIEADPLYCDAMDNLGRIYRSEGKLTEAIQLYTRSLEISPTNVVALTNLAVAYKFNDQLDKAIETYLKLKDIDISDPESYYGLGTTYMDQNKYDEAVKHLLQADKIYSDTNSDYSHHSGYLLGISYFKLGKCSESIHFLERSYQNHKSDPEINFYLGVCHLTKPFYSISQARNYLNAAEMAGAIIPETIKTALTSSTPIYVNFGNSK